MKRGVRCIAQTISMSDSKTSARPKRVQKLVSAELVEPCPNFGHGSSSYWTPRPVAIRICTRKDMQRTSRPKICVYPPKRRTKGQILLMQMFIVLKFTILATLLYWMCTDGNLPFFVDIDKIHIPRFENVKYSVIQKYNHAVLKTIDTLIRGPQIIFQKFSSIISTREETVEDKVDSEEMFLEDDQDND